MTDTVKEMCCLSACLVQTSSYSSPVLQRLLSWLGTQKCLLVMALVFIFEGICFIVFCILLAKAVSAWRQPVMEVNLFQSEELEALDTRSRGATAQHNTHKLAW